jgi:hypothetical protein
MLKSPNSPKATYNLVHFPKGGKESVPNKTTRTRGVSHCGLAIYIKKYLKAKEELWKIQIFHHAKI